MSSGSRYFQNDLVDFPQSGESPLIQDFSATHDLKSHLRDAKNWAVGLIREGIKTHANIDEDSVYTGGAGIAYMFVRLAERSEDPEEKHAYLHDARKCLRSAESAMRSFEARPHRRQEEVAGSLLCGAAGHYAVAALLRLAADQKEEARGLVRRYAALSALALAGDSDEWLYGRAGYLHGCLALRAATAAAGLEPDAVPDPAVRSVADKMMESGRAYMTGRGGLMYAWMGDEYLGAAHGVVGVAYTLLHVPHILGDAGCLVDLNRTVDWILAQVLPSGNLPAVAGESEDLLVHFCHGAPGLIPMLLKAWKALSRPDCLRAALRAGDVVWARGLLRKGPGICHGIAGNGYAFLSLFRATGDMKHLHRALQFATFLFSKRAQEGSRTPDNPYSLFEGLAGAVCFLQDLEEPLRASFPLFELPDPDAEAAASVSASAAAATGGGGAGGGAALTR